MEIFQRICFVPQLNAPRMTSTPQATRAEHNKMIKYYIITKGIATSVGYNFGLKLIARYKYCYSVLYVVLVVFCYKLQGAKGDCVKYHLRLHAYSTVDSAVSQLASQDHCTYAPVLTAPHSVPMVSGVPRPLEDIKAWYSSTCS